MILMLLLIPIFKLINGIIGFLPNMEGLPSFINDSVTVISYALQIVPIDVWVFTIGSVIFWSFAQIGWSVFEWIYKKIPGVD